MPAILAMLAVTVLADAASALIGIRFGWRRWAHNAGKTYVGSAAGTAVAFIAALPFVGAPLAALSAAVFLIVDVAAPVPIPVSDNILNPLALAGLYVAAAGLAEPLFPFY